MEVFVYAAALICEDCGKRQREELCKEADSSVELMETGTDSDGFPQGPYPDGGGEADSPQHCDQCGVFLDNALTGDGETYVRDAFREYVETGRGSLDVLIEWRDAFDYVFGDFTDITYPSMREQGRLTDDQRLRFAALFEG